MREISERRVMAHGHLLEPLGLGPDANPVRTGPVGFDAPRERGYIEAPEPLVIREVVRDHSPEVILSAVAVPVFDAKLFQLPVERSQCLHSSPPMDLHYRTGAC